MKTFGILLLVGTFTYILLSSLPSNDYLITTYCRRKVQDETERVYDGALRFRDRPREAVNIDDCLEEMSGITYWEFLKHYLTPRKDIDGMYE
jgi:hypothetical protein